LAILGGLMSIYTINHHLHVKAEGETDFACNINEIFSCDDVVNTRYSEVAGIPLGVWGLGYFLATLLLLCLALLRGKSIKTWLQTYTAMAAVALGVAILAVHTMWFAIGAFCPSCLEIHIAVLLQAAAVVIFWKQIPLPYSIKALFQGGVVSAVVVVLTVAGFKLVEPRITPPPKTAESRPPPLEASRLEAGIPNLDFSLKTHDMRIHRSADSGLGEDYRKGRDDAEVVIVEFSDFQCPGCAGGARFLGSLVERYGDEILLVFKNYPLDRHCNSGITRRYHEHACEAAVVARCAGAQGKFWEFHDLAFAQGRQMNSDKIREWAVEAGLSDSQIDACLADKDEALRKIRKDISEGERFGIEGTPTIFLNGRKLLSYDYSAFTRELERILSPSDSILVVEDPLREIRDFIAAEKGILIDVREIDEWSMGYLEGAMSFPLSRMKDVKRGQRFAELPSDKVLYTYCSTGARARLAARVFEELKYEARPLPISLKELTDGGFELARR
jgi:protein-disulfide isomerase/rhodanese-related sulfurtransferase